MSLRMHQRPQPTFLIYTRRVNACVFSLPEKRGDHPAPLRGRKCRQNPHDRRRHRNSDTSSSSVSRVSSSRWVGGRQAASPRSRFRQSLDCWCRFLQPGLWIVNHRSSRWLFLVLIDKYRQKTRCRAPVPTLLARAGATHQNTVGTRGWRRVADVPDGRPFIQRTNTASRRDLPATFKPVHESPIDQYTHEQAGSGMFGKADPYCKIVIGTQEFSTRPHKVRAVPVAR